MRRATGRSTHGFLAKRAARASSRRGRGARPVRRTRVFFHRHSNWRASRKVENPRTARATSHGRWPAVYFCAPHQFAVVLPEPSGEVDGGPDVGSDGWPCSGGSRR